MTVTASPDVIARASQLTFVSHGDGGPTLILPNVVLAKYWGTLDASGNFPEDFMSSTHYGQACNAGLIMPFEGQQVLVLQEEGSTAWVPEADGGLLLRWVGADSAAALLAAVQDQEFEPVAEWTVPAGGLTFMHAVEDGRAPADKRQWESVAIDLPAGEYAIEALADGEWSGGVAFPDGHVEDTMVQCYRVARRAS